ncbi:MAG: Rrf2 family transcriptional regulator [Melioribacteraceae bacterium]|nr:Rrf2 family transcriptional regulator [Melioribacteraceae bacterium]
MLKISKSVEYSILALKQIYNNSGSSLLTAKDIALREKIPTEMVAKLLQKLKKNGILESVQGKFGGYRYATEPAQNTLYSIVEAIDLEIQITDCLCDNATKKDCERIEDCSLRNPLSKLQDEIIILMKNLKLTDLLN